MMDMALLIPLAAVLLPVLVLLILGALVLVGLRILTGGRREARGRLTDEDTRLIQEVHRDLGGMEKRIEALETLILDRTDTTDKEKTDA